jgi:Domain of unknown function (DUF1963)
MIVGEGRRIMKKMPPFRLVPEPQDEQARNLPKFKWASPEIGTRHQLGGEPNFLQNEEWPECPTCHKGMTFYGQLDSVSDDFCIADCGMIYVFICFGCCTTSSMVHSY